MITSHMNGSIMGDSQTGSAGTAHNKPGTNHGALEWDDITDDTTTPTHTEPSRCSAQMKRIQHYQEELRKKREEEGRQRQAQTTTTTTSINSSLRLKKLSQDPCPKVGIDNPTFEPTESDRKESVPAFDGGDAGLEDYPRDNSHLSELDDLLVSLEQVHHCLGTDQQSQEDLQLVVELLRTSDFQTAFQLHCAIALGMQRVCPPFPLTAQAQRLCQEVESAIQSSRHKEGLELKALLTSPHVQALMEAHDGVAEQELDPEPSEMALSQYGDTVKLVRLQKTRDIPLGATVRNEQQRVVVSRVVKGGAAERSGLLREEDEILEINGIPVRGKNISEVQEMMLAMNGTLTLLLIPNSCENPTNRQSVMHVKAYFDYDPSEDPYLPCRELGLSFQRGDILHIISQDDPNWWQAYRDGEVDNQPLAGLVPGKTFQQQRETLKKIITDKNPENAGKIWCAKNKGKKPRKRSVRKLDRSTEHHNEEILTYEEMALFHQPANRKRPIALIGPPNKRQDELKRRLLAAEPNRFASAVPHTTRQPRPHEVNGREYHFVTRLNFETDMSTGKFLESGEFEKNLYGTTTDSVRQVINSGRICLLCLQTRSLRVLRSSNLKPYIIFMAPPSLERLRTLLSKDGSTPKVEELKDVVDQAQEMEQNFGHLFDAVVINDDQDRAYQDLKRLIDKLDVEPQWVPSSWLC
ncbi:MAGUK p55 subfamily member 5b isoform X1 [Alosa pseudoharengus]|uniref:MAGUK p55 subfamily member 5b isoform X1 n=1 Tax=Alosa pseudoharengus TaxID=34774 RepID=UPI003F8B65B2